MITFKNNSIRVLGLTQLERDSIIEVQPIKDKLMFDKIAFIAFATFNF
jgi:hypothetical protein